MRSTIQRLDGTDHPLSPLNTPCLSNSILVKIATVDSMRLDRKKARSRILRVALNKPHRYRRFRLMTMAVTLSVLFAVPLIGLARVDLWGHDHRALGNPVALSRGIVATFVGIVGFYIVTFLINIPAGRMFCGFGCPVGHLSRLSDRIDAYPKEAAKRHRAWLDLVAFAAMLSLAVLLWWTSPMVFFAGEISATAVALGATALLTAASLFHGRYWRWSFCRKVCPIGLYYSVVRTTPLIEVDFDRNAPCTDCKACETICPAQLDPRHLERLLPSPGGLAFGELPAVNHCLQCGECIEICEHQTRKKDGPPPMGFRWGASPSHIESDR